MITLFDNLFNGICNGFVTIGEHPVAAGVLALGTALTWAGLSRWSHR